MKKELSIGIVGCGSIADIHAMAIQQSKNAVLVSAFSRTLINAQNFGEKFNIQWFTDWNEFISDPDLDAVAICTPNGTHLDYGKKVAFSKKHLIIEKPIEVTLERAKELIEICKENQVQLAIIYQNRFQDGMQELKNQIDSKNIGKLIMGDAYIKWYRSQEYYDSGAWRGTFALDGGGVLINQAIHTIDLLQWFMGPIESIQGQTGTYSHDRLEGEDNATALIKFKNGAMGVIQASTSIQPAQPRRIEIHGSKGTVIIDGDHLNIFKDGELEELNRNKTQVSTGSTSPMGGFHVEPHKKQFEAFVDAIHYNHTPVVSGEDSLISLAIVLAIYESAKSSKTIVLDDFIKNSMVNH